MSNAALIKLKLKAASDKKEAATSTFKTRSPMYCRQMSDDVKAHLEQKAGELNVATWLIVEKILENTFGIESGIDLNKWLGVNANRARTGKPYKKKVTK